MVEMKISILVLGLAAIIVAAVLGGRWIAAERERAERDYWLKRKAEETRQLELVIQSLNCPTL